MEREVRYCTTEDGVRIAYTVEGDGPPLVWCAIFVESFGLDHVAPGYRDFLAEIGSGRQFIRYDMRGVGLSDRDVTDFSCAALVRDIAAVVKAANLEEFAIWGNTMSGPRAIRYAHENPGRVTHLTLFDTFTRAEDALAQETAMSIAQLAESNWKLATELVTDLGMRSQAGATDKGAAVNEMIVQSSLQSAAMYEQSAEGSVAAAMIQEAYENWDVSGLLNEIRAPTLVIHHVDNRLFPVAVGRESAANIPNARFIPLHGIGQGPDSTSVGGGREEVLSALEKFLPPALEPRLRGGGFRTILFTDVEGSTALIDRLGDAKARELLRVHEQITREALREHEGSEVKTMGDGFMASFSSATKAIECAIALQRAFAEHNESTEEPIKVRVGLNAGEPIAEDDPGGRGDLFGTAVNVAARIALKAQGGKILASNVVRELVAGKDFLFNDRGDTELRGFEDPVRLFEVSWQEK
ncbi:MAG TPA: adenylate/guanylate cyclase domain-containing protein [Dehalococcoidia bacterium]